MDRIRNHSLDYYTKTKQVFAKVPTVYYALLTTSLLINLLSLAVPIVTLQVYDRILTYHSIGTLRVLTIGVVIAIILDVALRIVRSQITGMQGKWVEHTLGTGVVQHMLQADLRQTGQRSAGAYVQDFNALQKLKDFYNGQLLGTLVDVPFVFIFLGLIAYLGGWVVVTPVILLGGFIYFAVQNGWQLKTTLKQRDQQDDHRLAFMVESLDGMSSIKSLALEPLFQRRYEYLQNQTNPLNYQAARLQAMSGNMSSLFSQIMVASVVTTAAPFIVMGQLSTGTMIACVLLSGRIMQPVQRALGLWTKLQDMQLAQQRLKELLDTPQLSFIDVPESLARKGKLQCIDMAFTYDPDQPYVVNNINISIEAGESIAISGEYSSGKSTLLALLAGLYLPSRGSVLVDGLDIAQLPPEERCKRIAYLPTKSVIFRGTILENLTGFQPDKEDAAREIAAHLDIDNAVSRLPKGFETRLEGGNTDTIPPGLKQRISIARVLLDKPKIILFDHADRALDRDGYNTLFKLIGRLVPMITLVLVSDDKNLLNLADKHFEIHRGTLQQKVDKALQVAV